MAAGRDKVYHQRQRSPRNGPATLFHKTRGGRGITSPAARGGGQAAPGGAAEPLTAGTAWRGQGEGPLKGYFLLSEPTETHTRKHTQCEILVSVRWGHVLTCHLNEASLTVTPFLCSFVWRISTEAALGLHSPLTGRCRW